MGEGSQRHSFLGTQQTYLTCSHGACMKLCPAYKGMVTWLSTRSMYETLPRLQGEGQHAELALIGVHVRPGEEVSIHALAHVTLNDLPLG